MFVVTKPGVFFETFRAFPALFVASKKCFKPDHDVFLTPTRCFLCLNLTRVKAQHCGEGETDTST